MKEKLRLFDKIIALLMVAVLIGMLLMVYKMSDMIIDMGALMESGGLGGNPTVEDVLGDGSTGQVLLSGDEADTALNKCLVAASDVRYGNNYILVNFGEDSQDVVIYNTEGENIYQDSEGNTTVFMRNGQGVYFSDTITYGTDCDLIHSMWIAAMAAAEGAGHVYSVPLEDSPEGIEYYFVEIEGYDNITTMYSYIDNIYAAEMVDNLKESVAQSDFDDLDTSNVSLRYAFFLDNGTLTGGACYLFFGQTGSWSNAAVNWYFEGVTPVGDWELGEEWYNFNYDDESQEAADTLGNMLVDLHSRVTSMLEEYEDDSTSTGDTNSTGETADVEGDEAENNSGPSTQEAIDSITEGSSNDNGTVSTGDNGVVTISPMG